MPKITVSISEKHKDYLLDFAEISKTTTPSATLGKLLEQISEAFPLPEHTTNMWEKLRPGLVSLSDTEIEPDPDQERKEPEDEDVIEL